MWRYLVVFPWPHLFHNVTKTFQNMEKLKSRNITLPTKVCIVKAMFFPVIMYRCESWTIMKAEHRRTDAFESWLEKTFESPLDSKEIKTVNLEGNQPWIIHWKDWCKAEATIFWPPDGKSRLIGKDPDAGKDWRQKEKKTAEYEMVGQHHRLNGHELGQISGDGEG